MRVNKYVLIGSLAGLVAFSAAAAPYQQRSCPKANEPRVLGLVPTYDEISSVLNDYEFELIPQNISLEYLEHFLFEYAKFPESLRNEISQRGGKIHLIEGQGVTVDPSWNPAHITTVEGARKWEDVPGSGGFVFSRPKVPTRVVVNKLYEGHGSSNLFLHEHGHTLDNIYSLWDISDSKSWKGLMEIDSTKFFVGKICGDYCLTFPGEAFAESFAYYHNCEATREHMEVEVPSLAEFFKNLTSVKEYKRQERAARYRVPETGESETESTPRRRRSLRDILNRVVEEVEGQVERVRPPREN